MKTLIIFLLSISYADIGNITQLDDQLYGEHWSGPKAYISLIKKNNKDVCSFLKSKIEQKNFLANNRIILSLRFTTCSYKKDIVKENIGSEKISRLTSTLLLLKSLTIDERIIFREKVHALNKKYKDDVTIKKLTDEIIKSI